MAYVANGPTVDTLIGEFTVSVPLTTTSATALLSNAAGTSNALVVTVTYQAYLA